MTLSSQASALPKQNQDGTLTAVVDAPAFAVGETRVLALQLPAMTAHGSAFGRYFLARCGAASEDERHENWQIYLRRPLFAGGWRLLPSNPDIAVWQLLAPEHDDPGYRWLVHQPAGAQVNLLGPFGQQFSLPSQCRALLLIAESAYVPVLLPLATEVLDAGGRVTLVVRTKDPTQPYLPLIPLAVEVQTAKTEMEWQSLLSDTLRWADHLCLALPQPVLQALLDTIRRHRFHVEADFAHALVIDADLICGVGACLACVIPLPDNSFTRTCIHGPVFRLTDLAH